MPDTVPTAVAPVDAGLTDPKAIEAIVTKLFESPAAGEAIGKVVKNRLEAYGIDSTVDRQHLALPETEIQAQRAMDFDTLMGRNDRHLPPLKRQMKEWFRFVLFGREVQDEVVKRALSEGTDSAGGYVVPPGFIAEVIKDQEKLSNLYQWCRQIPVPTHSGTIPSVMTNATVSWGSENAAFAEGDPAFTGNSWVVHRMNVLTKISRELANDANPNIVDLVTTLFREKIVEERDRVTAVGTGSGQPMGLYSAAGLTEVPFTAMSYVNLVALHESVDERYFASPSCRWVMNQTVKAAVMKVRDDVGRPIFQVDPSNAFRATIFGHPVSIEIRCPNNFIFFGDLRYYLVFNREQLGVERSTEAGTSFETHQLWIKFWERWDGKPIMTPFKPMARNRILIPT